MSSSDADAGNSTDASVEIEVPSTANIRTAIVPIEERREMWRGQVALLLMVLLAVLAIGLIAVAVAPYSPV